jgi:hypothetical protein
LYIQRTMACALYGRRKMYAGVLETTIGFMRRIGSQAFSVCGRLPCAVRPTTGRGLLRAIHGRRHVSKGGAEGADTDAQCRTHNPHHVQARSHDGEVRLPVGRGVKAVTLQGRREGLQSKSVHIMLGGC